MEAVGCSREIAEKATRNMDYDLSMAMHHAMYMQSVYLAEQSTQSPEVTKRFKKDDEGTVTANATDPMQMLQHTMPILTTSTTTKRTVRQYASTTRIWRRCSQKKQQ